MQIGDRVKLVKIPHDRNWISEHCKVGMRGVIVDKAPGVYQFTVYWPREEYEGKQTDSHIDLDTGKPLNTWQLFYVEPGEVELEESK